MLYNTYISGTNDFQNTQRWYKFGDGNANEGDIGWSFNGDSSAAGVMYDTDTTTGPDAKATNTKWHHVLLVVDTEQEAGTDRMVLYLDGARAGLSDSCPIGRGGPDADWRNNWYVDKGFDTGILSGALLRIGDWNRFVHDPGNNWCYSYHGHMADIYMVDGYALKPSDFGERTKEGNFRAFPRPDLDLRTGKGSFHLSFSRFDVDGTATDVTTNGNHFQNFGVTDGGKATLVSNTE